MKALIWFVCMTLAALMMMLTNENGQSGVPFAIAVSGGMFWLARFLCKKWDNYRFNKESAQISDEVEPEHSVKNEFCIKCGAKLLDNDQRCLVCGTDNEIKEQENMLEYELNGYTCPRCKLTMDTFAPCERCGYVPRR